MSGKDDIQKVLDEMVKDANVFIASPDTLEQMKEKGLPISSVHQTYEEYLDKLFEEKHKRALENIQKLPHLDDSISNSTLTALFEELKETFALGINGASIVLAILLFDIGAKFKVYSEKLKRNPQADWKTVEDMYLSDVVKKLFNYGVINEAERDDLLLFVDEVRDNYMHYNIQQLVKDMRLAVLPGINIHTGERFVEYDVNPADKPFLWFSAKRVLDEQTVQIRVEYCVHWVNRFLAKSISEK